MFENRCDAEDQRGICMLCRPQIVKAAGFPARHSEMWVALTSEEGFLVIVRSSGANSLLDILFLSIQSNNVQYFCVKALSFAEISMEKIREQNIKNNILYYIL